MKKLLALILCILAICSIPALASQSTISFPTTGTLSGLSLVTDINNANNTLASFFSGTSTPSSPASPVTYQLFANTSTNPVNYTLYDGTSWVSIGTLDTSAHTWTPSSSGSMVYPSAGLAKSTGTGWTTAPAYGLTGNNTLIETGTGGLISAAVVPTLNQATTGAAGSVTGVTMPSGGGTLVPTTGTGATGIWPITISGQAATVATISGLISAGSNVTITGAGTSASPYAIAAASGTGGGGSFTGGTLTSKLVTETSTVANAPINIPPGSAPTTPANGDMWTTSAGVYARVNGATVGPFGGSGGAGSFTTLAASGAVTFTGFGSVGQSSWITITQATVPSNEISDGATLTSHYNSVILGSGAGAALNHDPDSVYIGNQAGNLMTSEGYYEASNYATTGNGFHNVAIGSYAMGAASASGCSAGSGATGYTVAVGSYAGANEGCTSNGYDNTFLGDHTGFWTTTGSGNTIVGGDAMGVVTGSLNVLLGYNTGGYGQLTSGSSNVLIGPFVASTKLATGSNNILIGTSAVIDTTASGTNNQIIIGTATGGSINITGSGTPSTEQVNISGAVKMANLTAASATKTGYVCVDSSGNLYNDSVACLTGGGGGSGTVNSAAANYLAYYSATGTAVSGEQYLIAAQEPAHTGDVTNSAGSLALALANTATARTDLGLGSIATQAASSVAITGGTLTGVTATLSGLTLSTATGSTQCLQVNSSGLVAGTGTGCGSSSGGITALTGDVTASGSGSVAATLANTATARSDLGLGTSATVNTGTSGATIPLLNGLNVWSGSQRGTLQTVTPSGATYTPNFDTGSDFLLTLTASCPCTLANPSTTPVAAQHGVIYIVQGSAGSETITTWGSDYLSAGGTSTITLSTGANAVDAFSYTVKDSTHIILSGGALNVSH